MDRLEKTARSIHRLNNRQSEPRFRVAWKHCLPAYREMILAEAAEALRVQGKESGMELVFEIRGGDDLPAERIAEYVRLLNQMLDIDAEWQVRTVSARFQPHELESAVNEK